MCPIQIYYLYIIGSIMEICKLKYKDYVKPVKIDSTRNVDIRSIYFTFQPKSKGSI